VKRSQLFPKRKTPGPKVLAPALTPEQATANRIWFEQEIEPFEKYATVYFSEFWVGNKLRRWLLPGQTWKELTDDEVNYVCLYMSWFKRQIEKSMERQIEFEQDEIPGLERQL
jgi:hypothetical protein